jgi:hypothetical protein
MLRKRKFQSVRAVSPLARHIEESGVEINFTTRRQRASVDNARRLKEIESLMTT